MENNQSQTLCKYPIVSASYIGNPRDNTVMFVMKKIESQISKLASVNQCLVFHEDSIIVPDELQEKHCFISSSNPQMEYARFVIQLKEENEKNNRKLKYTLTDGGFYLGEDVSIGENAYIEPGCIIGHHVQIGKNAVILANTVIKNATIGDYFYANENSAIGVNGFTMAKDEEGNLFRIPTIGRVIIGNHVEIGALNNVSCGSAGDTILHDYVKLDSLVYIPHDMIIEENVEIASGAVFGGFGYIESGVFVGFNSIVKNRIRIGKDAIIGMGAVVTKSVEPGSVVIGNPAKPMERNK
jgi:UDP-3-O-[3-hydroxymyristoyl] glucosamine N-acyltransferase LpxD